MSAITLLSEIIWNSKIWYTWWRECELQQKCDELLLLLLRSYAPKFKYRWYQALSSGSHHIRDISAFSAGRVWQDVERYPMQCTVQCRVWLHVRAEGFRKLAEVLHPPSPAQRQQQCWILLGGETYYHYIHTDTESASVVCKHEITWCIHFYLPDHWTVSWAEWYQHTTYQTSVPVRIWNKQKRLSAVCSHYYAR